MLTLYLEALNIQWNQIDPEGITGGAVRFITQSVPWQSYAAACISHVFWPYGSGYSPPSLNVASEPSGFQVHS